MRALTTFGVVIALIVGLSLGSYYIIDHGAADINQHISKITQTVDEGNWDAAKKEVDDGRENWQRICDVWAVVIHHSDLEDIEYSFRKLDDYVDKRSKDQCEEEIQALKMKIDCIDNKVKLTWSNVL